MEDGFGLSSPMTIGPFLAAGLPMGECWPEWRGGNADGLGEAMRRPISGVLFDLVRALSAPTAYARCTAASTIDRTVASPPCMDPHS